MKHFIYTYTEGKTPKDGSGTPYTVQVWLLKRNRPIEVGTHTDKFRSEFQLVMDALRRFKALPQKTFTPKGLNKYQFNNAVTLEQAGVATLYRL